MPKAVVAAKNDILIAYIVPDFDYIINKIKFVYGVRITISVAVFMVPNVFHILDKMPVTAGDKIDRAALLEYQFNSERTRKEQQHERKRRN
jgi:hypothetical protein